MSSLIEAQKISKITISSDPKNGWVNFLVYHNDELLAKILKMWRTNLPSKEILEDLKKMLNFSKTKNRISTLLIACSIGNKDEEFYNNLVYFGVDIDIYKYEQENVKCLDILQIHHFKTVMFLRKLLKEACASRIIVRAVKRALDDEIYLTDLRKKIDLRRYLDLVDL
jgi:hypothetical protein